MNNRMKRRQFLTTSACSATGLALAMSGISAAQGPAENAPRPGSQARLETDFECGGGKRIRQLAPDHWRVESSGDRSGYTKYFCIRVTPRPETPRSSLRLDVYCDSEFGEPGQRYFASHFPSNIWTRTGDWPRRARSNPAQASAGLMRGTWGAGEAWAPLQNARKD